MMRGERLRAPLLDMADGGGWGPSGAAAPVSPTPADGDAAAAEAPPAQGKWLRWVGPLLSAAILAALLLNVRGLRIADLPALLPRTPLFWALFLISYLAMPVSEWLIYRRLWAMRPAGFPALLRKLVSNEILFGYSGELYFYAWARQSSGVAAPFGAIKDVAILSALVGNGITLLFGAFAYAAVGGAALGPYAGRLYACAGLVMLVSLAAILFRRRVFSLPPADRRFIGLVHALRLVAVALLTATMWHLVLPEVGLRWWLLLAALQLVVCRLPLITNKDFVFAGIAVVLLGRQVRIAELLTMMAALMLLTHLAVALLLTVAQIRSAARAGAAA
jgi:hypothetical protein